MQISFNADGVQAWSGEILVLGLLNKSLESQLIELERGIGISFVDKLRKKNFTAKSGEIAIVDYSNPQIEKLIFLE